MRWVAVVWMVGCQGSDRVDVRPTDSQASGGCPALASAPGRGGDGSRDADNASAWFRSVRVDGLTDADLATPGAAWVDLDRDGWIDVVLARTTHLEILRNQGCFELTPVTVDGSTTTDGGVGGPLAADLNQDGHLDLFVPLHGAERQAQLWVSQGAWDRFEEQAAARGLANPGNYARVGASVGDLDRDGWLDLAVGGHQIGGAVALGRPLPGLYVFRPGAMGFEDGSFENLANTSAAPGFGGADPSTCAPGNERTGLHSLLRDLDDDGDLDLLWATHNDMLSTTADDPCETGSNPYGLAVWLGASPTDIALTEQVEAPGHLSDRGRMAYDSGLGHYLDTAEGDALGAESLALFDADNDGDRDLIAVGPTDPDWHVSSGQTLVDRPGRLAGFFQNNDGSWSDATTEAGLAPLNWTLGTWTDVFASPLATGSALMDAVCALGPQQPLCADLTPALRQPYPSHILPFDADNDGWTDLLFVVRQCSYDGTNDDRVRSVLFHNQGDGRFEALPTEVSGVSGCAIGAFAVDIDADGWLDLHLAVRESLQTDGPLTDLVLRNRGAELAQGTRHWIAVRLSGRPEAELLGARVSAFGNDDLRVSNGWYEREAWRGSTDPTVHLGLSDQTEIRLEVRLRDGSVHHFEPDSVDATVTLDL